MKYVVSSFLLILFTSCSLGRYVTPQQYGAVADGVTDCTMPIKQMLSDMKAEGNRTAHFKEGNYLISDGIEIDFPCVIKGKKATIITKDTLKTRYAFVYTKSPHGEFEPNIDQSDLSLNFKVHAKAVGFRGFNNVFSFVAI